MDYRILDRYSRRGKKLRITIEIFNFGELKNEDGEYYNKSYAWGMLVYDGEKFNLLKGMATHSSYPVPYDLDYDKIEEIANKSTVAKKVLKLIK